MTACIVSLPERHTLLAEAMASVREQTVQPEAVLIGIDPRICGEAENCNRLIRAASTEWVAFLHDDDLWRPNHLEQLLAHSADADVVCASFDLDGRPESSIEPHHCDYDDLTRTNWMWPGCVMARRDALLDWGGFIQAPHGQWVDWTSFKSWLAQGARFACSHERTAIYRFGHGFGNGSWKG